MHTERTFFLNGSFVPESQAVVSVLDRGFLFADAVYEVFGVVNGRTIDNLGHLMRLDRSLAMLSIEKPHTTEEWINLQAELIKRNNLDEGRIYLQVTRGVADRSFTFPEATRPTVFMFTQAHPVVNVPAYETGISVVSLPEQRWARRNIKSTMLLAQVLAAQTASEAGAREALLVEDGYVTEGASSSAFIVTEDDKIVTRHLSDAILPSVTRHSILTLAKECALKIEERMFTVEEVRTAKEAFINAAVIIALPVVKIDDHVIGSGRPGPIATRLREIYFRSVLS
ncbi:D-amino-acid transaminase [Burkholderia sp. MR1-5-21]